MKRIDILLLLLLVCALARAAEYTVEQVPNVHLNDSRRFVSNPDGILSAETVTQLDQMLFAMQEANTSEIAVVALQSIGNADPDVFSTEPEMPMPALFIKKSTPPNFSPIARKAFSTAAASQTSHGM